MLRLKRVEIFLFVSAPLVTFFGTLVAKEVNKNFSNKLL